MPQHSPHHPWLIRAPWSPWQQRVLAERAAGNLTPLEAAALSMLPSFRGRGGIFPTQESIAKRALCSLRTVARALAAGAWLGLVSWREGPRRQIGWRLVRTSNCYLLLTPAGPVEPGALRRTPGRATTCQNGAISQEDSIQEPDGPKNAALKMLTDEARGLPDLLKARVVVIEARMRALYQRKGGDAAGSSGTEAGSALPASG